MAGQKHRTIDVSEYLSAALLKASKIRLAEVKPGDIGGRVVLVFDDSDGKAAALLDQHRNGGAMINSADFASAIRDVKDQIFSVKR